MQFAYATTWSNVTACGLRKMWLHVVCVTFIFLYYYAFFNDENMANDNLTLILLIYALVI